MPRSESSALGQNRCRLAMALKRGAREKIQSKKPQKKETAAAAKTLAAKKTIYGETFFSATGRALISAWRLEALCSGCCVFRDHSGGIRCVAENIGFDGDNARSCFVAATRVPFCCFERQSVLDSFGRIPLLCYKSRIHGRSHTRQ